MKYPKPSKQLIVTVTEEEKVILINASEKSYRPITSIAREGALTIAKKILKENATRTDTNN